MEVAACQSALASCYSALEFGGIAVSAASPLAASHPNLPLFAAPSSPPPSVAPSSLPSAVKSTLPFTALSSLPSAEISTPPPLTPTQSTLQRIRFHNHGQECSSMFPEHMVFKFCSVLLNGFNWNRLSVVCPVHGDSSGAGGSSGYGHGGHSQPPASPVAEIEVVAEGPCEGPWLHVMPSNRPQLPSLGVAPEDSWYPVSFPMDFFGGG